MGNVLVLLYLGDDRLRRLTKKEYVKRPRATTNTTTTAAAATALLCPVPPPSPAEEAPAVPPAVPVPPKSAGISLSFAKEGT